MKQIKYCSIDFAWKTLLVFIIFNIQANKINGSGTTKFNEIISPNLKTVQFHREGWPFSYPLISLNSDQKLLLTFDELGHQIKNYYYTVTLFDINWNESRMLKTDYLRGTPVNPLDDYSFSFNTTFDFVHYSLLLPNENMNITRSGNYVLKVFENNNDNNPVLVKRFMVIEPIVKINGAVRETMGSSTRLTHHEIDFEIFHPGFTIHNPVNDISVTIMQNGRTDNMITGLRPLFFRDGFMDFNYNLENLMEGGNEFRYLDIRSNRFLSDRVKGIDFIYPFFHVTVSADLPRKRFSYQHRKDLNGRFYIEVQERKNPSLEADYLFTHFTLTPDDPNPFQKIYINGALTNWQINSTTEMKFNHDKNRYEITLLLKQGYYNYQFLVLENGLTTLEPIEGNFEQTENDYLLLVYYKSIGDRYHRIIGADVINSLLTR